MYNYNNISMSSNNSNPGPVKEDVKVKQVKEKFLNENGCSDLIDRYGLKEELPDAHYTSGDSVFRSEGQLGKEYKIFRFGSKLDLTCKSSCWDLTEEDEEMITKIHAECIFPKKGDKNYHNCQTKHWIKFFGKGDKIIDQKAHPKIRREICKLSCAHCLTRNNIECDHKNDLYLKNDPRVKSWDTQTIDDFQPLCKHCNDVKRGVKEKMMESGKRIGAKSLGLAIDFTQGDETLDMDDPEWYKGTYWGDCKTFKQKLCNKYEELNMRIAELEMENKK